MDQTAIDFERDARQIFIAVMSRDADQATSTALQTMNVSDLVIQYLNWRNRLIFPQPRTLFKSNELVQTVLADPTLTADFDALCRKIQNGDNLLPHLSTRITTVYQHRPVLKPLAGRRDYDLLLNDWGIHHVHLGHEPDPKHPGFNKHADRILFGIFRSTQAFLVDINTHRDFEQEELVRIAVRNWPDERLFIPLSGVMPGSGWTPDERKGLRSVGMGGTVDIDGTSYIPGVTLGMTTSGVPLRTVREASIFLWAVQKAEAQCLEPTFTRQLYDRANLEITPSSLPRLASITDGWGIVDQATNRVLMRITS